MKSPLSSIIMGSRFLHSGKVDDKPEIKEKYFSIIESEAEHLLALVNKLLTISKLENKKLILNKQLVNLETVIDDIVEKPQQARKALKNCDTNRLKDLFYIYCIAAPSWADEVMDLVPETKIRKWLINKIIGMLSDDELIEEMGI